MKLNSLKELVKEELKRVLNKVKVKVDYITEDPEEGGPLMDRFTTKQIDQADFDKHKDNLKSNFWKEIAQEASDERIYKIDKITKL
jgi:hypothetical protein